MAMVLPSRQRCRLADVKGRTITVMGVGGAGMAICGQSALEGAKKIHVFAVLPAVTGSVLLPWLKKCPI